MSLENEAEKILEKCSPDKLKNAITNIFRQILGNLLLEPKNSKFQIIRKENNLIRNLSKEIPELIIEKIFNILGFNLTINSSNNSELIYSFNGDLNKLKEADKFLSYLENKIQTNKKLNDLEIFKLKESKEKQLEENRKEILLKYKRDLEERKEINNNNKQKESLISNEIFNSEDFKSVEDLKEKAKLMLLNTGRVRNSLFEGKDFNLRRMKHGRVYVCKEGCGIDYLEAHWHLYSGKNLLYSFIAHLSPDASSLIHLGVEHGYQYNSLPGTKHFQKTVNFSSKKINQKDGTIEFLNHPDKPCESCIYCGVPFSQLFL